MVTDCFSDAPKQIRDVINEYWDSLDYVEDQILTFNEETGDLEDVVSYYCSVSSENYSERYIVMNSKKSDEEYGVVFRHEYGHYIDDITGRSSESSLFSDAFQRDKKLFDNATDIGITNANDMLNDLSENMTAFNSRYVSDIISALTNNNTKIREEYKRNDITFFGHEWGNEGNNYAHETFANLFAIYAENNSDVVSFTEKWFPSLTEQFKDNLLS